jgi:sulfate permease, SulP family
MPANPRWARARVSLAAWLTSIRPRRSNLKSDLLAGLPGAISSVPDGMAASVLAGVNPVHGLYASFAGPIAGGLTASTRLMVITTTSAAALAAGSALEGVAEEQRPDALILLTLIAGLVMVVAAFAHVGRYIRFVSHSVMLGFLTGIGVNIILGQIPDLLGISATGSTALTKAVNALAQPSAIEWASLATGLGALALQVLLARTRLGLFSSVIALVIPTVVVVLAGAEAVQQVSDVGTIPSGLPLPSLPDLSVLSPGVITGALAVAAIILVQGAGVADAAPNPDGSRSNSDADVAAQGMGNMASGLFGGQPVGGSVGQTALNVSAGARSRWGGICSGLWMLLVLVALSRLVGLVAMPTLAAVLIYAAVGSFRPAEIMTVLRTGRTSQIALVATFAATLFLPVAAAVGVGVALSLLLQLNRERIDLKVVRLIPDARGGFTEAEVPRTLRDDDVVILDVYGSLFYAGARTLQLRLPDPGTSARAAVILRLRGRSTLGSTFLAVIGAYMQRLGSRGGQLYLSGLDESVAAHWERHRLPQRNGTIKLYRATPQIGQSTHAAFLSADSRVVRPADEPDAASPAPGE